MKKKFTASRISEGNRIFPDEVTIDDYSVTIKSPRLFSGVSKSFPLGQVSISINSPIVGYSDITLFSHGTGMSIHGFTKSDAQKIKRYIEEGKKGNNGSSSDSSTRSRRTDSGYDEPWGFTPSEINQIERRQAENQENFNKIKRALTKTIKKYYFLNYLKKRGEKDIQDPQIYQADCKEYQKILMDFLKKHNEEDKFQSVFEKCKKSARIEADKGIAEYEEIEEKVKEEENVENSDKSTDSDDREETQLDFELPDNGDYFKGISEKTPSPFPDFELPGIESTKQKNINQVINLTNAYDSLDVEILEDCDKVNENYLLDDTFIKNIIRGELGRDLPRKELPFMDFKNLKYVVNIEIFFDIINDIYNSIAYKQTEDGTEHGKKVFPYSLDYPKTIDYLRNEDNSLCDRISKLIDVTDNFIDRIAKNTINTDINIKPPPFRISPLKDDTFLNI